MASKADLASRGFVLGKTDRGTRRVLTPDGRDVSYREGLRLANFASPEQLVLLNKPNNQVAIAKMEKKLHVGPGGLKADRSLAGKAEVLLEKWDKQASKRVEQWHMRKWVMKAWDLDEVLMPEDWHDIMSPDGLEDAA